MTIHTPPIRLLHWACWCNFARRRAQPIYFFLHFSQRNKSLSPMSPTRLSASLPGSLLPVIFALTLAVLGTGVGWGAWMGQTTVLQLLLVGAVAAYLAAGWALDSDRSVGSFSFSSACHGVALAIAGAAVGGLAYYSQVALLHAMIWAAVLIWVERAVRNHLGDSIGDLFGWL